MVNKVIILGNVGNNPEIRTMPSGKRISTFSCATSEYWTDKSGEKQSSTEWHKIVVFNEKIVTNLIEKYLKKGMKIFIEGRLSTRKYTDANNVEKFTTEIITREIELISPKGYSNSENSSSSDSENSSGANDSQVNSATDTEIDDDIPF